MVLDPAVLIEALNDPVADAMLAAGEPSYESARGLLPDLVGYVPVAHGAEPRKLVVDDRGRIGRLGDYGPKGLAEVVFDPSEHGVPGGQVASASLEDGWMPIVRAELGDGWQLTAFATERDAFVRLARGSDARCWGLDPAREVQQSLFEGELGSARAHWRRQLAPAIRVDLPEPILRDASLAGIARAFSTCVGYHPKYGLGSYAQEVHDGFPPTVLSLVNACVEWGLLERAEGYLSYWLDRFVRADGTFDYYGPAVSEYGQLLAAAGRFAAYSGDRAWPKDRLPQLHAVADYLLCLRRQSQEQPEGSPTRGLLHGAAEADTRDQTAYYFSGTAWAWRGLRDFARLLGGEDGERLLDECEGLHRDLSAAARAALVPGDPPFLPPYPGIGQPFACMTAGTLESYTNYRYWPELLSAGALEPDLAEAVSEFRRRRGGELAGTTRFDGHLDDWPLAHHALGLLAADHVDRYLLTLYGHLTFQQTPGTYCAYEQVSIDGDPRRVIADYCVPAQLTVPLMVRRMLAHDDADSGQLWLARAVPRRWLTPGSHFGIEGARTRYGSVSYHVEAGERSVTAEVKLPGPVSAIALRLRRPSGAPIREVRAEGADARVLGDGETVILVPKAERVRVIA